MRIGRVSRLLGPGQPSSDKKRFPGARLISKFARDRRGDVAMLFGLLFLAMFFMIGLAVDFGRFINARNQTISATDAAVLAGARALQTNGGNQSAALTLAKKYYDQAVQSRIGVKSDTVAFVVTDNGTAVKSSGNVRLTTPFMGLAGTKTLPLLRANGSDYSKAVLAVGGNAELNLEISMMLDVSGSMGEGTKLADLKAAAKDLIDIVVWKDQSKFTSRVALVPFSGDVRPTATLLASATNPSTASTITLSIQQLVKNVLQTLNYTYYKTACVAERSGTDKYTDAAPASGKWILTQFVSSSSRTCAIATKSIVMPMTNDTTALKARITDLAAQGATAGQVGTAWAYYMLSPKWASILPTASVPVAYNTAKTKKIAILMTDGEYNSEHDSNGVTTGNTAAGSSVNGTSSAEQAKSICAEMKKNNIEVYTVGFDLGGNATAISTLKSCATDDLHYYNSTTGDALKQAFRDIALKISTLYLAE